MSYDAFANAFAAAGAAAGGDYESDDAAEGTDISPEEYLKQQYRQAEKEAQAEEAEKTCEKCGTIASECEKLMKCSQCLSAWYCSKKCQIADWKLHKKVCKTLQQNRIIAIRSDFDEAHEGAPNIPTKGIALSGSLTGFAKEVLCLIPSWDLDDEDARRFILSTKDHSRFRNRLAKSIKYYFKMYQTSVTAASQINQNELGNMCVDAVHLLWLGDPRVRQISVQEGMHGRDKFILHFMSFSPIPKGWKLNTAHYPPEIAALFTCEIEKYRNDPRFGEREE